MILEKFDFFRDELRLFVTMAECSDFLSIHPVEETFLACIAPCPNATIISENNRVVFSDAAIDNFETQFFEFGDLYRLIKSHIGLVSLSKHSPISRAEHVKFSILRNGG
jgi:hypothetical protein